jgi:plastocyanin
LLAFLEKINMASKVAYIAIAVVVIIIIIVGVLAFVFLGGGGGGGGTLSGTNINIYCGEYGYGTSASNIVSPGPTISLDAGATVTVTLHNVGNMGHNWAIVSDKTDGSTNEPFSGAQIGSASNPVAAGGTQSTTFTVGSAGNYYYICQVPGHVSLGMYGTVNVK